MLRYATLAAMVVLVGAVNAQAQIVSNPVLTTWTPYAAGPRYTAYQPVAPSPCCGAPVATGCNTCAASVPQTTTAYYAPAPTPGGCGCGTTTTSYAPPATTSYYPPAATTRYYAPAPMPHFYTPATSASYYAPTVTRYYPSAPSSPMPVTTTYRTMGTILPPATTMDATATVPATTYYAPAAAGVPSYTAPSYAAPSYAAPSYAAPSSVAAMQHHRRRDAAAIARGDSASSGMFWISFTVSEWVIRLVMLPVVTRRRKPNAAMAWLLLIFFLPWAGLLIFLFFGTLQFPRSRRRRAAKMTAKLEAESQRFRGHASVVRPHLEPQLQPTIQMAEQLGNFPILGGNQAEFLAETDEFIDSLVTDIHGATNHVHLLFYIFWDDETGRRVVAALADAVKRGVRCRVLVDDVGSRKSMRTLMSLMRGQDIEVHPTLPVGVFRRHMARVDTRNHRKLAVIDGAIAYTGSQNIVNADYGHRDLAWHDIMARLTGPITMELQAIFVTDWHQETSEILTGPDIFVDPVLAGDVPAQTLPSGPIFPVENYQRLVVSALHGARKRVIITTPYFVPDEPLLQAIQTAVLRGVTIDLIVPERCDQKIVGAAARAYYEDVLEAGANLYLFTKGLLHSKTITIDDSIALIGSGNFDIRSFEINFELSTLLYGADVTRRLRDQQLQYLGDSYPLDVVQWRQRSSISKLIENTARLLSPIL